MAKITNKTIKKYNKNLSLVKSVCSYEKDRVSNHLFDFLDISPFSYSLNYGYIKCEEKIDEDYYRYYTIVLSGNIQVKLAEDSNHLSIVKEMCNEQSVEELIIRLKKELEERIVANEKIQSNKEIKNHQIDVDTTNLKIFFTQGFTKPLEEPVLVEDVDFSYMQEEEFHAVAFLNDEEYEEILQMVSNWQDSNQPFDKRKYSIEDPVRSRFIFDSKTKEEHKPKHSNEKEVAKSNVSSAKIYKKLKQSNKKEVSKSNVFSAKIYKKPKPIKQVKTASYTKFAFPVVVFIAVICIICGIVSGISNLAYKTEDSCYFDSGVILEESTCNKQGLIKYTCHRHNEEKTENIPIKHNFIEHCICEDCGYALKETLYVDKVANNKVKDYGNKGKFISLNYKGRSTDLVVPAYLETEDDELLPVEEVYLGNNSKTKPNKKEIDVTIYTPKDVEYDIYIGNINIDTLTIFGDVNLLIKRGDFSIKHINIYGNLNKLDTNLSHEYKPNKLKTFNVTGTIINLSLNFFAGSKVEYINVCKDTETLILATYPEHLKNTHDICVDKNNKSYSSINGVLYDKQQTKLLYYPIGRKDKIYEVNEGVTKLDESLGQSKKLRKLVVPTSVVEIGFNFVKKKTNIEIYYLGDKESWYNSFPDTALNNGKLYKNVFFYSDSKIDDGRHWHYNKKGKIKVW